MNKALDTIIQYVIVYGKTVSYRTTYFGILHCEMNQPQLKARIIIEINCN